MKQANFLGEMFAANGEKGLIEYYAAKKLLILILKLIMLGILEIKKSGQIF